MNICITTDLLTERNYAIEVVETFLEIFDKATMVTIAHSEGAVIGPVEHRKITSSKLTHKIKNLEDLHRFAFLVPGVLDNHFLSCQYDVVINVSRGLSHGFKKCDQSKQITYLIDEEASPKGKGFFQKMFRSYVNNWALKRLKQVDELWVSSESLKEKLEPYYDKEILVVPPFIKVQDFPVIPKKAYPHNYYTINAEAVSEQTAQLLIDIFQSRKMEFRFVGEDDHLEKVKRQNDAYLFLGVKCNGDLSPILAASRGLIDLSQSKFPSLSVCALSSGRPVIVNNNEFLEGKGVLTLEKEDRDHFEKIIAKMDQVHEEFEPENLHAKANAFHQLKFKGTIQRRIGKREEA